MRKIKRKVLSCLLIICLSLTCIPFNAFAEEVKSTETFTVKELGVIYERTIENDKIIVNILSLDGKVLHTIEKIGEYGYLDGELVYQENSNIDKFGINSLMTTTKSKSVDWGSWSSKTEIADFKTGGLTTVIIAGFIVAYAPQVSLTVAGIIAGAAAGMYKKITIKVKIRYGSDDEYQYYERYTYFYGDGELITLPENPFFDSGKKHL